MTIKRVSSGPGLPAGFPFSLASEANGIVFISGMPALDAAGKFMPGTFGEEAGRAWASVTAMAPAGRGAASECVFGAGGLGGLWESRGGCSGHGGRIHDWRRKPFPDPARAPARLTYPAGALPFGAKIEFQAVAARSAPG